MEIVKLECPSCGAALESEDDIEVFFCKYCGAKILFDRENDKYYEESFQYKTVKTKLEHEKSIEKMRMDERASIGKNIDKKIKIFIKCYIIYFIISVVALVLIYGGLFLWYHTEQKKYDEIIEDIEECIDDEDYDEAGRLLRQLQRMDILQSEEEIINQYSVLIEDGIREEDPDKIKEIEITRDASDFTNLTMEEAQSELLDLGFYHIETREVVVGSFHHYSTRIVRSISIDNESDFSEGDEFPDNAHVVIYYYYE